MGKIALGMTVGFICGMKCMQQRKPMTFRKMKKKMLKCIGR